MSQFITPGENGTETVKLLIEPGTDEWGDRIFLKLRR